MNQEKSLELARTEVAATTEIEPKRISRKEKKEKRRGVTKRVRA